MTPMDFALNLIGMAFFAVFDWFVQILVSANALGLYLAIFAMYCCVRFLIAPLVGAHIAVRDADLRKDIRKERKSGKTSRSKAGED